MRRARKNREVRRARKNRGEEAVAAGGRSWCRRRGVGTIRAGRGFRRHGASSRCGRGWRGDGGGWSLPRFWTREIDRGIGGGEREGKRRTWARLQMAGSPSVGEGRRTRMSYGCGDAADGGVAGSGQCRCRTKVMRRMAERAGRWREWEGRSLAVGEGGRGFRKGWEQKF